MSRGSLTSWWHLGSKLYVKGSPWVGSITGLFWRKFSRTVNNRLVLKCHINWHYKILWSVFYCNLSVAQCNVIFHPKARILGVYNFTCFVDDICDYFGVKIGMYFAWLGFYTNSMLYPAVIGFLLWILAEADQVFETKICLFSPLMFLEEITENHPWTVTWEVHWCWFVILVLPFKFVLWSFFIHFSLFPFLVLSNVTLT